MGFERLIALGIDVIVAMPKIMAPISWIREAWRQRERRYVLVSCCLVGM